MARQLHVLNGDSTMELFVRSGLTGEIAVCREFLCEGPLEIEVGSDDFWKKRYDFFKSEFAIEKIEYFDKSIKEFLKFEDLEGYEEVVLWFEYDLFCQVNLLGVCSYLLKNFRKDVFYYLVCTGYSNDSSKMLTLSDFSPKEYVNLYKNKVKISKHDLKIADDCWKVFVRNEKAEIEKQGPHKKNKFPYIGAAMEQQLERFPKENGLNQIEQKIVSLIHEGPKQAIEIVMNMLNWQQSNTIYGFGDLQYFWYLKKLKNLYTISESLYYLNESGMQLVTNGDR